ncbi:hypothetical protein [Dyadobacter sp. CY326]|uniref:hypothetical protein n=1 Tax=Dyadobacter sp. CY326 TaxID=2907300 RepID=UPI001F34850B|nr:hypothetical protein [Dyadobacter sp. CY326]MCE7065064.1 hypothetical protein [Dyadobacter sp. CY326]
MKVLLIATLVFGMLVSYSGNAQSRSMAKQGEKVWVFVNTIKADKRQQFEQFLHEVFWKGAEKLNAEDKKVFKQTRVLHPTAAEADGNYSYLFVMDPVIEGGDYDIESLLKKMYGQAKASEYIKVFEDASAGEQKGYLLTQSQD